MRPDKAITSNPRDEPSGSGVGKPGRYHQAGDLGKSVHGPDAHPTQAPGTGKQHCGDLARLAGRSIWLKRAPDTD